MKALNGERSMSQEGELLRSINTNMNSMRLVGMVPNFDTFKEQEAWWLMSRHWTNRQKTKYQAWWDAIYRLQRDKDDKATVGLIIAYALQEMARRRYEKEPFVFPHKLGVTDEKHAARVCEYVVSHYEKLDPELGIGV
jgi:hypothetical protein